MWIYHREKLLPNVVKNLKLGFVEAYEFMTDEYILAKFYYISFKSMT